MTQQEAAALLRTSVRTVERRIRNGVFLAKRENRRVLIDRGSVEDYVANLPTTDEVLLPMPAVARRG